MVWIMEQEYTLVHKKGNKKGNKKRKEKIDPNVVRPSVFDYLHSTSFTGEVNNPNGTMFSYENGLWHGASIVDSSDPHFTYYFKDRLVKDKEEFDRLSLERAIKENL